jgi:hypothetical protein
MEYYQVKKQLKSQFRNLKLMIYTEEVGERLLLELRYDHILM